MKRDAPRGKKMAHTASEIVSACWANAENTAATLQTTCSGAVLVSTVNGDFSGGWRVAFAEWRALGNTPSPCPGPLPIRVIPVRQFITRITTAKQMAVVVYCFHVDASGDLQRPQAAWWLIRCLAASSIDLDAPITINGIDALVTAGILTTDDKIALLA